MAKNGNYDENKDEQQNTVFMESKQRNVVNRCTPKLSTEPMLRLTKHCKVFKGIERNDNESIHINI